MLERDPKRDISGCRKVSIKSAISEKSLYFHVLPDFLDLNMTCHIIHGMLFSGNVRYDICSLLMFRHTQEVLKAVVHHVMVIILKLDHVRVVVRCSMAVHALVVSANLAVLREGDSGLF